MQGASGRTATLSLGSTATIAGQTGGGQANPTVLMTGGGTLSNLTISNTSNAGTGAYAVRISGGSGATVSNSTLSASDTTGGTTNTVLIHNTATSVVISGNTISATGQAGNQTVAISISSSGVTVSSNSLSASGGGGADDRYINLNNATIATGSSGNSQTGGNCNITAAGGGSVISFTNAANCGP